MWFEDIFGYHVMDIRPEPLEQIAVRISQRRDIVQKSVEPDIGNISIIKGKCDTPLEPCLGTGYTEIFQGFAQKSKHLVPITLRSNEIRTCLNVLD